MGWTIAVGRGYSPYFDVGIGALFVLLCIISFHVGFAQSHGRSRRRAAGSAPNTEDVEAPRPAGIDTRSSRLTRMIGSALRQTTQRPRILTDDLLYLTLEQCELLQLEAGFALRLFCFDCDYARYHAFFCNAIEDLCAKVKSYPEGNRLKRIEKLVLARHRKNFKFFIPFKPADALIMDEEERKHLTRLGSVLLLDTLTKVSEQLMYCPNRVSAMYNKIWTTYSIESSQCVSYSLPAIEDILKGHEQLSEPGEPAHTHRGTSLHDLNVFSPLLSRWTWRLPDLLVAMWLKLAIYLPALHIKVWAMLILLYVRELLPLHDVIILELTFAAGSRILLLISHLLVLKTYLAPHMVGFMVALLTDLLLLASERFVRPPASVMIAVRVVSYTIFNAWHTLSNSVIERRQFRAAASELFFSLTLVFSLILSLIFVDSVLIDFMRTVYASDLCHDGALRRVTSINGCSLLRIFSLLCFFLDIYPLYWIVAGSFGFVCALATRIPRPFYVTWHDIRLLGKTLVRDTRHNKHQDMVLETSRLIGKGLLDFRKRDIISSSTLTRAQAALNLSHATGDSKPPVIPDKGVALKLLSIDSSTARSVILQLFRHLPRLGQLQAPDIRHIPSVTVIISIQGERILLSMKDLLGPSNTLRGLVFTYETEFENFLERMTQEGLFAPQADLAKFKWFAMYGSSLPFNRYVKRHHLNTFELELRMWASLRARTVARTLIGALQYAQAIMDLYLSTAEPDVTPRHAEKFVTEKVQILLSDDRFVRHEDQVKELEDLLCFIEPVVPVELAFEYNVVESFGSWRSLWPTPHSENDETRSTSSGSIFSAHSVTQMKGLSHDVERFWEKQFCEAFHSKYLHASVRVEWDSQRLLFCVTEVLPRSHSLLAGQAESGCSTPSNRHTVLFARGEVLQFLGSHNDWFYLEVLSVPRLLSLFYGPNREHKSAQYKQICVGTRIFNVHHTPVSTAEGVAELGLRALSRVLSNAGARPFQRHPDFVVAAFAKFSGDTGVTLYGNSFHPAETCKHVDYVRIGTGIESSLEEAVLRRTESAVATGVFSSTSPHLLTLQFTIEHWRAVLLYLSTSGVYDCMVLTLWTITWLLMTCLVCILQREHENLEAVFGQYGIYFVASLSVKNSWPPLFVGSLELLLSVSLGTALVIILKATVFGLGEYVFQWISCFAGYTRGLLKRKYPSRTSFFLAEEDGSCATGFRRDDMRALVAAYMSTHLFVLSEVLELLIAYFVLSSVSGATVLSGTPVLSVVALGVMAPLMYNPSQTWRTTGVELKKLAKYLVFSTDPRDQTSLSMGLKVKWHTVDFDKPYGGVLKYKSFAYTYLFAFFRDQDAWSSQLSLWLLLGFAKAVFVVAIAWSVPLHTNVLQAGLLLWLLHAWLRLIILSFRLNFCHAVYAIIFGLAAMLVSSAMFVIVVVEVDLNSLRAYHVVAAIWLVTILQRICLTVVMRISSVLVHRRARLLISSLEKTDRTSKALAKAYETQEHLYWCMDSVCATEITRIVTGVFLWVTFSIAAVLSIVVWKLFVPAPTSIRKPMMAITRTRSQSSTNLKSVNAKSLTEYMAVPEYGIPTSELQERVQPLQAFRGIRPRPIRRSQSRSAIFNTIGSEESKHAPTHTRTRTFETEIETKWNDTSPRSVDEESEDALLDLHSFPA